MVNSTVSVTLKTSQTLRMEFKLFLKGEVDAILGILTRQFCRKTLFKAVFI